MPMNNAQEVFAIFYGLYFAATIPMTASLRPFDTPAMHMGDKHAGLRLIVSFLSLNVAPLGYFVFIFSLLGKMQNLTLGFWPMLFLLTFSLAGFGFYRIYFGLMLIRNQKGYVFYGKELPDSLAENLTKRGGNHAEVWPHLIPGFLWIVTCTLPGLVWIQCKI